MLKSRYRKREERNVARIQDIIEKWRNAGTVFKHVFIGTFSPRIEFPIKSQVRALSYGYISGYRASHIVRVVLCWRIIEIFTSNYPGNARLLHSITANFSHPSSSMHSDISKIRNADMPARETIPRQTIRARQISHETPDTHGGANSRDLRASYVSAS